MTEMMIKLSTSTLFNFIAKGILIVVSAALGGYGVDQLEQHDLLEEAPVGDVSLVGNMLLMLLTLSIVCMIYETLGWLLGHLLERAFARPTAAEGDGSVETT